MDKNSIIQTQCIIHTWKRFGPERRTIKWLKLPFSQCPHGVASQRRILLQPLSPKFPSILNLVSCPELPMWPSIIIEPQRCNCVKMFGNLLFFWLSAIYSMLRLNRFNLWFVSPYCSQPIFWDQNLVLTQQTVYFYPAGLRKALLKQHTSWFQLVTGTIVHLTRTYFYSNLHTFWR